MMNNMELKGYRLLTYVLALPNAFMAIVVLFGTLAALFTNPILLFPMFVIMAVVFYAIFSFIFLHKNMLDGKISSYKFKIRLKLSALLSLVFCILNLSKTMPLVLDDTKLKFEVNIFLEALKESKQPMLKPEFMEAFYKFFIFGSTFYVALLLLHILMTYKFSKLFNDKFEKPKMIV